MTSIEILTHLTIFFIVVGIIAKGIALIVTNDYIEMRNDLDNPEWIRILLIIKIVFGIMVIWLLAN